MLRLVIGGRSAGKYEYMRGLGYGEEDFSTDFSTSVLYKLGDCIEKLLKDGDDVGEALEALLTDSKIEVVVCDEVGCGIVPIDAFEREYREAVGRACIILAEKADIVERVFCGIAVRIKG